MVNGVLIRLQARFSVNEYGDKPRTGSTVANTQARFSFLTSPAERTQQRRPFVTLQVVLILSPKSRNIVSYASNWLAIVYRQTRHHVKPSLGVSA